MNLIQEYLAIQFALKLQLTPLSLGALLVLGFCFVVAWRWAKGRIR